MYQSLKAPKGESHVSIIGAGIAGAWQALLFAQAGHDVTLHERNLEDLHRLVRRRGAVEVDERVPPAHGARQDREVGPDPGQLLVGEGGGSQLRPRRSR